MKKISYEELERRYENALTYIAEHCFDHIDFAYALKGHILLDNESLLEALHEYGLDDYDIKTIADELNMEYDDEKDLLIDIL